MPLPSPVRPWHGEQNTLKRSWPRAISVAVTGIGNVSAGWPSTIALVEVPVLAQLPARHGVGDERAAPSARRRRTCSPRAARSAARRACPGGSRPSASATPPRIAARAAHSNSQTAPKLHPAARWITGLRRNFGHSYRMQPLEERPRRRRARTRDRSPRCTRKKRSVDARANAGTLNTG